MSKINQEERFNEMEYTTLREDMLYMLRSRDQILFGSIALIATMLGWIYTSGIFREFPHFFLLPLAISLFGTYYHIAQSRSLAKVGTYVQVFLENTRGYENRSHLDIYSFKDYEKSTDNTCRLDLLKFPLVAYRYYFPGISIILLCIYYVALYNSQHCSFWTCCIILAIGILLFINIYTITCISGYRKYYILEWNRVLEQE